MESGQRLIDVPRQLVERLPGSSDVADLPHVAGQAQRQPYGGEDRLGAVMQNTRSTSHSRNRSTPAMIANGIMVKTARKIQNTAACAPEPSLPRPNRSPSSPGMDRVMP